MATITYDPDAGLYLPGRGLGLKPEHDPRNTNYPVRTLLRARQVVKRRDKTWSMFFRPLNQGTEGTCVGHGFKHWQLTAPVVQGLPNAHPNAVEWYDGAAARDPWAENDPGKPNWRAFGTSLEAAAKYGQSLGLIGEYRWSWEVDEVADYLAGVDAQGKFVGGSVILGLPWFDCWWDVDDEGFLPDPRKVNTRMVGGHCMLTSRWEQESVPAPFLAGPQSWGSGFGLFNPRYGLKDGRWKMDADVFHWALNQGGEALFAQEQRLPR